MNKVSHFSLRELINIAYHKVGYKLLLGKEKFLMNQKHFNSISLTPQRQINYDLFSDFYSRCYSDKNEIFARADKLLSGTMTVFGYDFTFDKSLDWLKDPRTGVYWNDSIFFANAPYVQIGCSDVKNVLEVNKLNHLVHVALAFYHSSDEKYIKYIDESIQGWQSVVFPAKSVVNRIMMDLGFRSINLIQILLLCQRSKYFQDNTQQLILRVLKEHERRIRLFSTPRWFKTGNGANHAIGEMVGLIVTQLILEGYGYGNYKQYYSQEYKYLREVLIQTISPSGVYLEQSCSYSRVVLEFLDFLIIICNSIDNIYPIDDIKEYKLRLRNYLKHVCYHNKLQNFGDNDDAQVLTAFRINGFDLSYLLGEDEILNINNDQFLDGSQWIYQSKDNNDLHLFTRVGRFAYFREGTSLHIHNDILSLLLCAKGQHIFIDKGCLFYNVDAEKRKEYRSVASHNTVFFDGIEMHTMLDNGACFNYPDSKCLKSVINKDSCEFSGYVKYFGIEHSRNIAYHNSIVTITDTVVTDMPYDKAPYIAFLLDPLVQISHVNSNTLVLINTNGDKIAKMTIEGIEKIEINSTTYSPSFGVECKTNQIKGRVENGNKVVTQITL
jgi:hypothetical protein